MRTKWEILQWQREELLEKVKNIDDHMEWAAKTPFKVSGSDEPGKCSQCQEELPTEADFEKHFIIPDGRYFNLGYCPNRSKHEGNCRG